MAIYSYKCSLKNTILPFFFFYLPGLIYRHHFIYYLLRTTFKNKEPKLCKHCDYKKFDNATFLTDLKRKQTRSRFYALSKF